jgi:hypothetical protein
MGLSSLNVRNNSMRFLIVSHILLSATEVTKYLTAWEDTCLWTWGWFVCRRTLRDCVLPPKSWRNPWTNLIGSLVPYRISKYCRFIHLVVCLTTGPNFLPNRALHIVRSSASSFKCEYPLLSLRSSSSFLRFLPRLPVTSIPPFVFPSITRCRRQFLRKVWPIPLAFRT